MFKIKNYIKYIKTCNLYFTFISLGLILAVLGPSLLDLQQLINTDSQHISLVFAARSTGYIVGALLSGVVLDLVKYHQAILSVCCLLSGGTIIGLPWSSNFGIMLSFIVINGLFLGAQEIGGNVSLLNIWGKDSRPLFQGLHCTLGLGGFIAPLIEAPYLKEFPNVKGIPRPVVRIELAKDFIHNLSLSIEHQGVPGIVYPYSIIGCISCLTGVLLFATAIASPTEESAKDDTKKDNASRSLGFMTAVTGLSFLIVFFSCLMNLGYAQMITSYVVKSNLHLQVSEGSYMASTFWVAFTASHLVSAFLSIRIRNFYLIVGDLALSSVSALILLLLMPHRVWLWIATVLFGFGIGPIYSSTVGWINTHVYVTSKMAAILSVSAASGEMAGPVLISYFIDTTPDMFAYVAGAAVLLTGLAVLALYTLFRRFDKKPLGKDPEIRTRSTTL